MERPKVSSSELLQVRQAVRESLAEFQPGDAIAVACSGGADSIALAYALALEVPHFSVKLSSITIDHQLQPGSADNAEKVSKILSFDSIYVQEKLLLFVQDKFEKKVVIINLFRTIILTCKLFSEM